MMDSLPTATKRALLCLALTGGWAALAATEAHAVQSSGPTPGSPAQQAAEGQEAADQDATEQEAARTLTYGLRVSSTFLHQDSLNVGLGATGFAVFPVMGDLELEGEIGLQFMSTEKNGLPEGSLKMFPVRATLRVQMWRFGGTKPYLGGGAGMYFSSFSQDSTAKELLNQLGIGTSVSIDPALGVHVAGGTEVERGRFHFGIDVKYVFGEADVLSTVVDTATGNIFRESKKLDIDGLWIAVGARFSF